MIFLNFKQLKINYYSNQEYNLQLKEPGYYLNIKSNMGKKKEAETKPNKYLKDGIVEYCHPTLTVSTPLSICL